MQRPATLGIIMLALWAVVLAIVSAARVLFLTQAVQLIEGPTQSRVWLVFLANIGFGAGFGASAYALWRQHNWGRLLFLGLIVMWAGFGLAALLIPDFASDSDQSYTSGDLVLNGLRYSLGVALPLWYLNLPYVKALFLEKELS